MLHMFGDVLYHNAESAAGRSLLPNASYTSTRIHPVPGFVDSTLTNSTDSVTVESLQLDDVNEMQSSESIDVALSTLVDSDETRNREEKVGDENIAEVGGGHDHEEDDDVDDSLEMGSDALPAPSTPSAAADPRAAVSAMDLLLRVALLRCLKFIAKDATLPVPVASLWASVLK